MKLPSLIVLFQFIYFFSSFGQESEKPIYTITPRVHHGFIWSFTEDVAHLANQHVPGLELNLTAQCQNGKEWQRAYRNPQTGYSLYYFRFQPEKPLGDAFALLVHAGKNFFQSPKSNLQWRIGFGGAFIDRRYHYRENFKNNVISQRLNFTLNGQLNFNTKISPRLLFNVGLDLIHFSNGAFKRPNFGINILTAHVGVGYLLSSREPKFHKKDSVRSYLRKNHLDISLFSGLREVYPVRGPKYYLGGLTLVGERRYNRKSGLQIGVDLSYDHSKKSEIEYDTIPVVNNFINRGLAGVLIGHELYINRLSLVTQAGIYVFDPTKINRSFYQKLGFKYYLSEKIYTNMTMKIHLGVADWVEWGIGVKL